MSHRQRPRHHPAEYYQSTTNILIAGESASYQCQTHTHTHTLSLSHTHTHTLSLSHTHTRARAHARTHAHTHSHIYILANTYSSLDFCQQQQQQNKASPKTCVSLCKSKILTSQVKRSETRLSPPACTKHRRGHRGGVRQFRDKSRAVFTTPSVSRFGLAVRR